MKWKIFKNGGKALLTHIQKGFAFAWWYWRNLCPWVKGTHETTLYRLGYTLCHTIDTPKCRLYFEALQPEQENNNKVGNPNP